MFLSTWHTLPPPVNGGDSLDWAGLMAVREVAGRALEGQRETGAIGSGLDAALTFTLLARWVGNWRPWG